MLEEAYLKRTITCRKQSCPGRKDPRVDDIPESEFDDAEKPTACPWCNGPLDFSEFWVRPGKCRKQRPTPAQAERTNEQLRKRNAAYDRSPKGQEERHATVDRLRAKGMPIGNKIPGLTKS